MPSIELAYHPVLEELHKPTLTLFVKKHFLFWRKKNFPEGKSANVWFRIIKVVSS